MKERFPIQLSVEKEEKKQIIAIYKKHSISMASRILNLIREDIKKLGLK